jgi:hypothetical protein
MNVAKLKRLINRTPEERAAENWVCVASSDDYDD